MKWETFGEALICKTLIGVFTITGKEKSYDCYFRDLHLLEDVPTIDKCKLLALNHYIHVLEIELHNLIIEKIKWEQ